jgi:uncharacterized protein (DUF3084 family)
VNTFWAVFLAVGGGSGIGSLGYTVYKDHRDRRIEQRRQEVGVAIDEVTEKRIAAEAAQINSDVAIAQQTWWRDQFDVLREELTAEQNLRRRLTQWAREHQTWDQRAWELAVRTDPTYPAPPRLDDM